MQAAAKRTRFMRVSSKYPDPHRRGRRGRRGSISAPAGAMMYPRRTAPVSIRCSLGTGPPSASGNYSLKPPRGCAKLLRAPPPSPPARRRVHNWPAHPRLCAAIAAVRDRASDRRRGSSCGYARAATRRDGHRGREAHGDGWRGTICPARAPRCRADRGERGGVLSTVHADRRHADRCDRHGAAARAPVRVRGDGRRRRGAAARAAPPRSSSRRRRCCARQAPSTTCSGRCRRCRACRRRRSSAAGWRSAVARRIRT